MSRNYLSLKEDILQHVWVNLNFNHSSLQTEDGLGVEILFPGEINHLDGPDFFNAKIRIGNLIHFGSVEVHWNSKDWYTHGHYKDKNYDNVILHVVAEDTEVARVKNTLGSCLPSLNIFQALPGKLKSFQKKFRKTTLACSGLIRSISKEVVEYQLIHAQKEYLDQKVSIFFKHFDGHVIPSKAWKDALFITLCDALGVPANRASMKSVAHKIMNKFDASELSNTQHLRTIVSQLEEEYQWKRKGTSGINKPYFRITQAIQLFKFIDLHSLDYFYNTGLEQIWIDILSHCNLSATIHNHRLYVAFFLPAMYALGVILESGNLKHEVLSQWKSRKIEIPQSILKKFGIFSTILDKESLKHIGVIHQFNAYCKPLNCSKCAVLNKAILS